MDDKVKELKDMSALSKADVEMAKESTISKLTRATVGKGIQSKGEFSTSSEPNLS